ncbi:NAD(P)-dependent dehydrogenase (short-subunit alcohol dehydrogenase family) [Maribacter spongiicola]|uniref:NAD(P)-dependent dehydrogenase (Short-subunit alcohol dehydrogenase family) n=1 Tax=Maribacter spongiicola TaxID=1206753 RepID=A0A4R7JJU5_9FLAO|nr:SDR family NAD(P)-dependent oxidoreductase [Maribacter spongiicola]TDT37223.1 NAD(P)-dependent dehydrogenase (short-subunit alcohol dehydrogenase family) [Maribacter spongiicola]
MNLKDKIVIITGAGSGIGAATAKLFGTHGANVIVSDINLENANKVVEEIKSAGGTASAVKTDVTKFEEVESLITGTVSKYGSLDVMVNNAGISGKHQAKTADHTHDDWHNVIAVNQTGVFYCMQAAIKQMLSQGKGNIVNVASLAGLKASGNNLSYSASKFAVVGMTKSAALEYGRKNIRVNAVCPGFTHSALLEQLLSVSPDMGSKLKRFIPMGRFGEADEIAEAICWLASDNSKFITGQTITLDGGTSL